MLNAPLLGNDRTHGNRIMADMSGYDGMGQPKFFWKAANFMGIPPLPNNIADVF